jgi:alginate O-acetyltransferase complex protein AlgI
MLVVMVGWQIFYFSDLSRMTAHMKIMFFATDAPVADAALEIVFFNNLFWIIAAIIFCTPVAALFSKIAARHPKYHVPMMTVKIVFFAAIFLTSVALLVGQSYNPFLYWRF